MPRKAFLALELLSLHTWAVRYADIDSWSLSAAFPPECLTLARLEQNNYSAVLAEAI